MQHTSYFDISKNNITNQERWSEVWYIQTVRSKQWRYSTYQSVTGPDINTEYRNLIAVNGKGGK